MTAKSKKTNRLIQNILYTSSQLSSLNASKLLKSENITVCKSSICDLLKKMPSIVDKSSVKMICVDDFALRKRFSYGTVMINLENHRIIDMIPSRDTNDVCNWLKTFHNIEVISRDGAITYASAATNSHPDVIQISDRFHLIKGLSEVICKYIFREFPARVEIPLTESITDEMKALYNTANRSLRIKFAHEKRREGLTISDIALLLHSSPKTIQKYLAIPEDQVPKSKEIARERQHQLAVKQKEQEIKEAREMKELSKEYKVPFVINDNIEVALAVDADGVHIGQDDMSVEEARKLLGEDKIIGVSAHNVEEAIKAQKGGADYLGVGAVCATSTKKDANVVSKEEIKKICHTVEIPVVAIGGIKKENIKTLEGTDVDGVAVVSAIFAAKDIKKDTKQLRSLVEEMKQK